ncbi:unnamed protein product [Adineta ricciae]|nr:unnamed protein product [Adineta ricciae]
MVLILFVILLCLFICYLFTFPRYTEEDDLTTLKKYQTINQNLLSVMTFNIRHDIHERDPNNNFTKRVFRLVETVEKWKPSVLSVQEPFADQIRLWHCHLPKYYRYVGYQPMDTEDGCEDSLSKMDFRVAILYNTQILTLLEQDYIWLSKCPRIVGSKDWNSHGVRTLNIARFKLKNLENSPRILVFNTHLDVRNEQARQEQAKVIRSTIKQWQEKYPKDLVFLCGDFNTIPKQTTHQILTSSQFLYDTWTTCQTSPSTCISHSFSSSFHGWLGSIVNTYGFQFIQIILYTFRGLGVDLPYETSLRKSVIIDIAKQIWKVRRNICLSDMISLWRSHRIHVDWILYQHAMDGSSHLQPKFIAVGDIRSRNYSSDHFPIIALFQITPILP